MSLQRRWSSALILGLTVAVVAACASPAASPGIPAGQPAAPAASSPGQSAAPAQPVGQAQPQYGGVLNLGQRDAPESMHFYNGIYANQYVFNDYYEPLINWDQREDYRINYPLLPWLAESWEQPNDTTVIFKIRDGVKWHDGTPLTAEAVAWNFEYIRNPDNKFAARSNISTVDKITVEPGNKVKFTLTAPTPGLLVTMRRLAVMPKHIFDAGGMDALMRKSVGSGPFSLVSMDRTSKTTFKKFPEYWAKDEAGRQLPFLDGQTYTHNMDLSTQQAALAAGQLDLLNFPDRAQMDAFAKRVKEIKTERFHYDADGALMVNLKRPYMEKLEVRRALHLILNRHEINESFAAGEGLMGLPVISSVKSGWAIPQEELLKRPGWRTNKAEDLAEARRLLDSAGVPKDWEFIVMNRATFGNTPQGEIAANQFKQFGLNVKYQALDDATYARERRAGGAWDVSLELQASSDPTRGYDWFHSKAGGNHGSINDPEVDRLTEQMRSIGNQEELKKTGRQLQEVLLDRVYTLPLIVGSIYTAMNPWVNGFRNTRVIQVTVQGTTPFIWFDMSKYPANRKQQ